MSKSIFYITKKAKSLADRIKSLYSDANIIKYKSGLLPNEWDRNKLFIFIMATGIVVRAIAPLIKDKKTDPAVLVIDDDGNYIISLLSGHLGGANAIAQQLSNFLKAQPVITTASDVNRLTAIDLWSQNNNLIIEDWSLLPHISTKLLDNKHLKVFDESNLQLPAEFKKVNSPEDADLLITNKITLHSKNINKLYLRPKNIVLGIGCNSGTTDEEIEKVIKEVLDENNLSFSSVCSIATIVKKASEEGLLAFAKKFGINIDSFTPEEINSITDIEKSEAVFKATGAKAVAEPSAILASCNNKLLIRKQKRGNVTVAAAEKRPSKHDNSSPPQKGKIYVVGTGPGDIEHITPKAQNALKESEFIIGYGTYLELIPDLLKGKKVISTGMTEEIERCKKAIELANEGKSVSIISGGDPGIYAMAGLIFELLSKMEYAGKTKTIKPNASKSYPPDIEIIPGISALNACASRLGAPLMHDFASISLSDRLTPWEVITKRLDVAASSDFVIILYNPKSKGRVEHINIAVSIIQKYRSPETPVGLVKQAMREGETVIITDLKHLIEHEIDMQTTIIIGNSQTFVWDGWMITPRGYRVV